MGVPLAIVGLVLRVQRRITIRLDEVKESTSVLGAQLLEEVAEVDTRVSVIAADNVAAGMSRQRLTDARTRRAEAETRLKDIQEEVRLTESPGPIMAHLINLLTFNWPKAGASHSSTKSTFKGRLSAAGAYGRRNRRQIAYALGVVIVLVVLTFVGISVARALTKHSPTLSSPQPSSPDFEIPPDKLSSEVVKPSFVHHCQSDPQIVDGSVLLHCSDPDGNQLTFEEYGASTNAPYPLSTSSTAPTCQERPAYFVSGASEEIRIGSASYFLACSVVDVTSDSSTSKDGYPVYAFQWQNEHDAYVVATLDVKDVSWTYNWQRAYAQWKSDASDLISTG